MKRFIALTVLVLCLAFAASASALQIPMNEDPGGGGGNPGPACVWYLDGMLFYLNGPVFGTGWYVCDRPACGYYNWSPNYSSWFYNWIGVGEADCKGVWAYRFLWY